MSGKLEFHAHFTRGARDIVKKMLQSDLTKRYGNLKGESRDIKNHPWFQGLDWHKVVRRELPTPIKPVVKSDDDTSNFDDYSDVGPMEHEFELTKEDQELFADF